MRAGNKTESATELVCFICEALKRAADPRRASAMAAYMKADRPFYGVRRPQVAALCQEARRRFAASNRLSYERNVLALWQLPHREEKYVAIDYARQEQYITPASLRLYERMIREGAWWDLVDDTATNLAGIVLLRHRSGIQSVFDRWITDDCLWIRRAAIISQVKHKKETDAARLFTYCLRCAGEREFFICKAIGWALREYSKSNPRVVKSFLKKNRGRLAPLSLREGARHLVRAGQLPHGFPS